ncbi:MAG: glycosyltransferase [Eubacteriales bacterium]|nr:glycosyltransferase [Eubacteriales bacterium]
MKNPIVSICCLAYNHAPYIREALESFLKQRDVPFEIIIHDDCSTDGTTEILREYEAKYPNTVKVMYEEENQYSKGITNISGVFNFPRATGRYIAFCEGDDYWTDPYKLKKQVEYMDFHPECSMCCHSAEVKSEDDSYKSYDFIRPYEGNRILTPREVISHNTIIPSASMLFIADYAKNLPQWYFSCPVGDAPLHLFMLLKGEICYMDRPMSVYRMGRPGSWTDTMNDPAEQEKKWEKYYRAMVRLYTSFNEDSGNKYDDEVDEALRRIRFHTDINEGKDECILKPENAMFLGEMPEKEAKLLKLRAKSPKVYRFLQSTYKVLTKKK